MQKTASKKLLAVPAASFVAGAGLGHVGYKESKRWKRWKGKGGAMVVVREPKAHVKKAFDAKMMLCLAATGGDLDIVSRAYADELEKISAWQGVAAGGMRLLGRALGRGAQGAKAVAQQSAAPSQTAAQILGAGLRGGAPQAAPGVVSRLAAGVQGGLASRAGKAMTKGKQLQQAADATAATAGKSPAQVLSGGLRGGKGATPPATGPVPSTTAAGKAGPPTTADDAITAGGKSTPDMSSPTPPVEVPGKPSAGASGSPLPAPNPSGAPPAGGAAPAPGVAPTPGGGQPAAPGMLQQAQQGINQRFNMNLGGKGGMLAGAPSQVGGMQVPGAPMQMGGANASQWFGGLQPQQQAEILGMMGLGAGGAGMAAGAAGSALMGGGGSNVQIIR